MLIHESIEYATGKVLLRPSQTALYKQWRTVVDAVHFYVTLHSDES